MPSDPIILLDTPIVAGSFAVSKGGPHVDDEKRIWREAVAELASSISPSFMIRVPAPVCYELMTINKEWFDFISRSKRPVFRFAKDDIPNSILKQAANYYFTAMCVSSEGKTHKLKTMDPLIAAYSINGKHHLLTTNQKDFPESHFSVVDTKVLALFGRNGVKYRTTLYLLKPI